MLGICNGFQVLAEAGPGAGGAAAQRLAALRAPLGAPRRRAHATRRSPRPSRRASTLRLPIAHGEGNYFLPDDELDALEARGGVVFRYAPPEGNPNGSARDIAGVINERGNVCGLMPHPERAAEALLGSDDGLLLLRSLVESVAASASVAA